MVLEAPGVISTSEEYSGVNRTYLGVFYFELLGTVLHVYFERN